MHISFHCRFSGVSRSSGKNGKWISRCRISGHDHPLGSYSTEELAAQAHDKVLIYQANKQPHFLRQCARCNKFCPIRFDNKLCIQGLGTKNFPEASYDVDSIYLQESIGSLMASIRAKAAALTKAHQTSRYMALWLVHLEDISCQPCHAPVHTAHCLLITCGLVVNVSAMCNKLLIL